MNKFFISLVVGSTVLGMSAVSAQDLTDEGAMVMMSEIPGMEKCVVPGSAPAVPDGATATRDDIAKSYCGFLPWQEAIQNYQNCMDDAERSARDLTDDQKIALRKVYNRYVDDMTTFAEAFNTQNEIYNANNPDDTEETDCSTVSLD